MRRPRKWMEWTNGAELQNMAAFLHGIASGAIEDTASRNITGRYRKALVWARDHWQEGLPQHFEYDDAMKRLITAVLKEWDSYLLRMGRK